MFFNPNPESTDLQLLPVAVRKDEDLAAIADECEAAVLAHADFIGSTKALLERTISSPKQKFIVVTEAGILHQMEQKSPGKTFIANRS